jgi:hypothetical protein
MKREPIDDAERARIVEWARARGSDARDLRDAVHEASHGLAIAKATGLALCLHRGTICEAIVVLFGRRQLFEDECLARAAERLACDLAGTPVGDYAMNTYLEAFKVGVVATLDEWRAGIDAREEEAAAVVAAIRQRAGRRRARG